jgi:LmbE family N-acetylglucosaminyl deacetylase
MHKNDVTGVNKIATGKYVLATSDSRVEGGKPFLMVNGLYLQIKSIDEKPGGKTVVFLVRGLPGKADSWKKMREELLGDKAPLHCPKGSIRNDAFRGNMNITEPVTFWRNIAHLSSGPFEGMLESLLWFGSRISHTALGGRLLQKGYSREEISFFLNDPEIALDGMRKPLFSWTEKMDTDQAVAFITRTMPPFYDDAAMPTISFKDYLRLSAFHDAGTLSVASNIVDAARIRQASVRIDDYPLRGSPENSRYTATGRHLIMDGKVAAVLLGGGTAGRWFGYDVPERMRVRLMADAYKIGGRMRSFAELKLGRIMWAAAEAGEKIPVWIMTSALIDNEIKQFVGNNGYFAMRSDDIHYYAEGEVPRMNPTRADLKAAFPDKPESWIDEKIGENGGEGGLFRLTGKGLSKKTMGHFDAIASLWLSKELLRMTDEGVEYIHFSDATNLGTNIDPVILGMLEASNNDVLHVLARKDDIFEIAVEGADKKFTVIMRGGRITYSSLPETLVPMVRQKDAQGAETVEIMERATGRPVKADVKKRLEKGGTLVDVDGKPQILEGFRFPREYNQSALPHFSTAHQIVRVKAILQLFGMSEEEYRKASRQELLTRIDAVASRLNTYVELKEVLDESAGKTRIGAQFSRLSGDLTALFDTGYVIIDRDGNESECAFLPYKDRVDLERNKEAALGVLLNRTVFSDADGFVSPELDKRYKELYLDFKNGDGLNPDGLEEARALFEKTREGALLLDSRGRPVPVKDDTYGAILSSGMFTPQAVFVLNRLRDEVDAALGPGIMRYAVDESAYHIALSMFQDVIGNTDEGTLTEEERTTLFKLFADSAASVTKGRPFRLKLEGLRVLPGGGVIAAWKDTGGLTAMRKEFSRRAIAVMGAKASRLADPKNIIHTTLLRILENLDKPTLSRLKGKVESYSDMSGADITVEVSAVDIIHETRRFLAESRTLRTIRLEGRAGKSVLPPQHIEKAGLARTAVGAALAGAVSAALAFALPDMQWLPAALLACAAYACTISIVSAATLFYIARVLGERAGPIAFYDPESNSILYLTADGTYTKDEGRSLLAALPAFIRTIVRLHERAHAGGYGDPAAYIAPLLGLFRGSAAILPGAAPKALEKRYTSKGVLSSPEGAEIDLGVLEKALNVAGRTLSKKLHADIVLSAAGSAFLLSLVKKAVPFDKVNDMDVEVNIHGEVASEMLIKELGHAVNRVLRSKGLEVRDLAFYDWRTIKGVLVADAPGQRRFCEVDFIIKHLEVPPSPYAIVMFHKEFLIKRFSAAGTMMWSEEASNNGQVTLKAVDPLADPRKYIVRYLRYEYFFGASEIFKKMALEYLETPFSGYGALAEKIGRSGRIEALTRALGGDLNKAAAPVKAPASSVIEEKEGREELFAKLRYLQGKLKHADGMSGPAAAALREDVIKVETEILERMARRKFVDDGAEEIIADLVSAGTERSDVQRALILYNRLQGRFISGLLDNYHIGDVPVRFKGARGISFMTGADGTFRNMFRDRSVMIVETHPDDIMINIATTAKLLKATAKRTLFVNALPDQTGVSDEYADGVDRSRLPASIDPNDRTAIKRWVRAEEARLGARLLGFDEKDYRPLNLDLPLEKGVYDRDGKLLSFESIFREPSPEDQEKADELVRNNPDIDTYLLIFPFSNHPHHRMVTNMMLKAIARYNKRAEIFFWEDDLEFKQHYIKQNVYLFHDQGEQSRKEGNIIEAYPSQNRRRGGEFYARQAVKASLNAAEAGYEDIRHQGEMKELELRAFKKKYPHAERLFKVDLVEPPSLGEQQRAGSNVGTAAVKSPGFDDPDLRRTYDDQLKTFMALPLKERSTILEESSVNSKAGGFEKIDGAFALDEKGQPIPVRGSDTYGIITSPDVFTPQAVARMNVLRDEVVSALPEKVRRYVIDESAYRIVASIFQDMVPSANPGVKIPQKKLEELFTAFLDVLEREAPADGLRIRLEGLRVNPNGGVIAVWQNDGTILRIRKAFAARAEEIIGIDAMESLRSKNIVHVTLLRILSDIDAETLGKLKKIVEKHDNLRDENIVVTIRRLNAYHETEWLRPAKHQILSSVDLGGLSAGRGEYERAMQQSLAKIFAKEALERKPRFMLALPASIKDKDVRKRALEAVKNAANELVSVAGRNVELGFFDQTGKKDVEGFSSFIARENVKGLYIDESFFEDKHQDAAAAEKALKEMAQAITAEASAIVIGSSTRKETEQIMTRIKKLLPKIERADIDKDAVLAELKTEVKLLRDALETRKRAVKQFYNGASIAAAMNSAVTRKGPIAIGLTATVVGNDLFSADDMEDVARNEKITPYFIFGSAAEGRKPVASIEEAKEYLRSCDYSETALQKIRYIDGKGLSYNEVAGIIGSETGLDAGNIGIAAIEKEFARMPEDQGFLLEVGAVEIGGKSFYATMNSIQTLLNIMANFNGASLDSAVPGVAYDEVKKVFRYLPRAVPIDYNAELNTYREAIKLIRMSA